MTDDEAFVRAVAAAPGDDAPRLVYADWLDERGDPRAPYLRHEVRTPGDPALRAAARGLDPLWVARVSRPPVGVCADRVRFDTAPLPPAPPLTAADLNAYAASVGVRLPVQYRAFLLNQNGGYPYPAAFRLPADDAPVRLDAFGAVEPQAGLPDDYRGPAPMFGVVGDLVQERERLLTIAGDGADGVLFIGTAGPTTGRLLYHADWTHAAWDPAAFVPVADSLAAFLAALFTTDPVWAQAIIRDEPAALAAWLAAGGDPNATDPETEYTPLMYAIDWQRAGMVRTLLARGARATQAQTQLGGCLSNAEIAGLIDAARVG